MRAGGCRCLEAQRDAAARAERFRELCARYFHEQDAAAKRVLDWFESCKVDQISLVTLDDRESDADAAFYQQIADLGLVKCAVPGHESYFLDNINALETVKNQVRSAYHASIAQQKYSDFHAKVSKRQSSHYQLQKDASGNTELVAIVAHDYTRTIKQHSLMTHQMEEFVHAFGKSVGCHPFLAGLRAALQWNLESATVVAWNLSDAVFVESGGPEFADAALRLMEVLNFGHCLTSGQSAGPSSALVHFHEWHLDPYMSDHDLRELQRLLPSPSRLEGRPTGEKRVTSTARVNIHGELDEHQPFFERWCVVL